MTSRRFGILPGLTFLIVALFSCQTTEPVIPENLTQAELFQEAQEAAADERWAVAMHYYETFLERFPDDTNEVLAARYEIAFLHYQMGNTSEAREGFTALLERYENSTEEDLVEWPRVLAERLLAELEAEPSDS